jgi:hypothetical protein
METKTPVFALVLVAAVVVSGCVTVFPDTEGLREESCRDEDTGKEMDYEEAITTVMDSECVQYGDVIETYICNDNTGTWWFDMDIEREGCNPACVVDIATGNAEINWRCTGLESSE